MFILLSALGACGPSEAELAEQQRVDEDRKAMSRLQEWPEPPVPPRLPLGARRTRPSIPPAEGLNGPDPSMRIKYLTRNTGVPEIDGAFAGALERGDVIVTFNVPEGSAALFGMSPGALFTRASRVLEPTRLYPTLGISPRKLMQMRTEEDVDFMLMAIVHEYHHYVQSLTSPKDFVPHDAGMPRNAEECRRNWEYELDAYRTGCLYAIGEGFASIADGVCAGVTDDAFFRERTFFSLVTTGQVDGNPTCLVPWARLAGHPHPEAFAPYGFLLVPA